MNTKRNNKGFSRIDKTLANTAKQYNLESAFYRHKTIKHWYEIAGSFILDIQTQTKPLDFKKGVLTIACLSREIAAKLRLLAQSIIQALNQFLGRPVIYALNLET